MKINFLRYKFLIFTVSLLISLISIFLIFKKGFNYGIDFTGGIEMTISINDKSATKQKLEQQLALKQLKPVIQPLVSDNPKFFIRFQTKKEENIIKKQKSIQTTLEEIYGDKVILEESNSIGSVMSKENQKNILWAILWASICVIIYMSLRFKYQYGIAAVLALFHDLLLMSFFIILFNKEFSIFTITAFLTILGYSINDTIILFDRIREYQQKSNFSLEKTNEIFNQAINDVFSRTIITTLTTLFVVISLFIFSQGDLKDLAFALLIGVISGTYSSIYIATTSLIYILKIKPLATEK